MGIFQTAESVVALLREKNLKLAAAESCTGGLIAKYITDVPGASEVFECGVVAYSNRIKTRVLGVSGELLGKYGAVSAETAAAMAEGALALSGADAAVASTGVAGPGGGSREKPVGLSYIAVSVNGKTLTRKIETGRAGRDVNRENTAAKAIEALFECLI